MKGLEFNVVQPKTRCCTNVCQPKTKCCTDVCQPMTNVTIIRSVTIGNIKVSPTSSSHIKNNKTFLEHFGFGKQILFWILVFGQTRHRHFPIGRKSEMKQFQHLQRCFMGLFLVITFKEFMFHYISKRDVKILSSWSFIIL